MGCLVWEWVQDCWNGRYRGEPPNASAWVQGNCDKRVLRGGGWNNSPGGLRAANRSGRSGADYRNDIVGFRVAQTLCP